MIDSDTKESFYERLERIEAIRAADGRPSLHRVRAGQASGGWVSMLTGLCVVGGLAFGAMLFMGVLAVGPQGVTPGPVLVARADASDPLSLFVLSILPEAPVPGARNPVNFLPPAPSGWLRLTERDVQAADPLETLAAAWPKGEGVVPLRKSAAYPHVKDFVEAFAAPEIEAEVLAESRTRALYLDPKGGFLIVDLEFLEPHAALAGGVEALAAEETAALAEGEVLERLTLGGQPATNRTKPVGADATIRPIGLDLQAPNEIRVASALTSRAVIAISGAAAPQGAAAIIASMDMEALRKRLPE